MSQEIGAIYKNWRKAWAEGTNECFKDYCEAVDGAKDYGELRAIVGRGLNDKDLSTNDLKLVIIRARQVKTLNGWKK